MLPLRFVHVAGRVALWVAVHLVVWLLGVRAQSLPLATNVPRSYKNKLEAAVLDRVQEHILSADSVRRYIELAIEQKRTAQEPTAETKVIVLAIQEADAKLRRWEEALDVGFYHWKMPPGEL